MNSETLVHLVERRIGDLALPEMRAMLLRLATYDARRIMRNPWIWVFPRVQSLLQPDGTSDITPFIAAWGFLYAATIRLDQIQDHDPIDDPLPTNDISAQYNLLLTYAVLANSLLDLLDPDRFSPGRLLHVRRYWSDMLLRMASGQQRDLTTVLAASSSSSLDTYEEIARAKTGAAFALGFGGIATLLCDNAALIDCFSRAGELFGTLVQYADDLTDAADQPNRTVTLPYAFQDYLQACGTELRDFAPSTFWNAIFHTYLEYVGQLAASFPASIGTGLQSIFTQAFPIRQRDPIQP